MTLSLSLFCLAQEGESPKKKPLFMVRIGKATKLMPPVFPTSGCKCKISKSNMVVVEFVVDKQGNVESAKAISGHPFLSAISISAIRNSTFTVSSVDYEPVKVLGVVTYKIFLFKKKWHSRIINYELKLDNNEYVVSQRTFIDKTHRTIQWT